MAVPKLLAEGHAQLVVQASPQLAGTLRKAGFLDVLRLLLQPQVAGAGRPFLFGSDEHYDDLSLRTTVTASGAVALDYEFSPDQGQAVNQPLVPISAPIRGTYWSK